MENRRLAIPASRFAVKLSCVLAKGKFFYKTLEIYSRICYNVKGLK